MDLLIYAGSLIIGILIGSVGIGGVLMVPLLDATGYASIHDAVPIVMFCFILTGAVGTSLFLWHGSIRWEGLPSMAVAAAGGAFLGSLTLPGIPASLLSAALAALMILAGLRGLIHRDHSLLTNGDPPSGSLVMVSAFAGLGSAMTGTGGPLILVPLLVMLRISPLGAIAIGQVIQIPIALTATLGNALQGTIDLNVAGPLSLPLGVGVVIGALVAHRLPTRNLHFVVSVALVVGGATYAWMRLR